MASRPRWDRRRCGSVAQTGRTAGTSQPVRTVARCDEIDAFRRARISKALFEECLERASFRPGHSIVAHDAESYARHLAGDEGHGIDQFPDALKRLHVTCESTSGDRSGPAAGPGQSGAGPRDS